MADLPIACTLSPTALQARRQGLLADLLHHAQSHELTGDGLRVVFSADAETLATIARGFSRWLISNALCDSIDIHARDLVEAGGNAPSRTSKKRKQKWTPNSSR